MRSAPSKRIRILNNVRLLKSVACPPPRISDHDLERYHLGRVEEPELSAVEQYLLWRHPCVERAEECGRYFDTMRSTILEEGLE